MEKVPLRRIERRYVPPTTFLVCGTCGTENSRPFEENDYIFKKTNERCPKCGGNEMLIVGIYVKEGREKE